MIKVCFVCMGNICRSPTAEGVFRRYVKERNLSSYIMVDSAGTHGMHTGKSLDSRSMRAAKRRGFDLRAIRSRPVELKDFIFFDYIVAMDSMNLGVLVDMSPESELRKLSLMMDHAPNRSETEVPDPYYSGKNGFEHVLDLIEEASLGLLDRICADLEQSGATGATGQSCD